MKLKQVLIGTVAVTLSVFVWSTIMHTVLWPESSFKTFANEQAVNEAIRAHGSGNGMYYTKAGTFLAVRMDPNVPDVTQNMGPLIAREFGSTIVVALFLALAFAAAGISSAGAGAKLGFLVGVASAANTFISESIWYGYTWLFTCLNSVDFIVGWTIAGAVLGAIAAKSAAGGNARRAAA